MPYKFFFLILFLFAITHTAQSQDLSNIDTHCEAEEGRYPTFELFKFLTVNSFMIDTGHIIKDEEYMILPSSPFFNSNLNAIVKMGQEEMDLKDMPKQFDGMEIKLYQYKHPRDCGSFFSLYNEFLKSDDAVFVVFININGKNGFLAFKVPDN
jgi:hypothetical protein